MRVEARRRRIAEPQVLALTRVLEEDVIMRAQGDVLRAVVNRYAALVDLLAEKGVITLDEVSARLLEGSPALAPAP